MAFVTRTEARNAARSQGIWLAEAELRKSAKTPRTATFDIFLSHSSEDADVIVGVKVMLEREGHSVYVDWLEDPQLDRSNVTAKTAGLLRERMNNSKFLVYASSNSSPRSKWMPWELGYFDGRHRGQVGILPIVSIAGASFPRQEYLGLYPVIERLTFSGRGTRFGRFTAGGGVETLRTWAAR